MAKHEVSSQNLKSAAVLVLASGIMVAMDSINPER